MANAEWWDVPEQEYHAAKDWISNSMLEDFRYSVPLYYARHVKQSIGHKQSDDLDLGTVVHLMLLEPERLGSAVVIRPAMDLRTKVGKERNAVFLAESAGKVCIDEADYEKALRMADSVRSNAFAHTILLQGDGRSERSIKWLCARTGMQLRCRLDRVLEERHIVVDLKTDRDPSPWGFKRSLLKYGYHRKAAHYADGYRAVTGQDDCQVYFVVVGKTYPYECGVYTVHKDTLALAQAENEALLGELRDCRDFSDWRSRLARDVQEINIAPAGNSYYEED